VQHGPSQLLHAIFWHSHGLGFEQQELQHALELEHASQFIEVHLDSGHPVATTVFGHRLLRQVEYDL
jgi:hypothetical protein